MKTNLLLLVVFALMACNNNRHRSLPAEESDTIQLPSVQIVEPVEEISPDSLFYKELFNKDGLSFQEWKDSTDLGTTGESRREYSFPVLIKRGETQSFDFYFRTSNEKWSDGSENQGFGIYFKLKGKPETGKTLAEDQVIQQKYDWKWLSSIYVDKINQLLYEQIKYPKKVFIHPAE